MRPLQIVFRRRICAGGSYFVRNRGERRLLLSWAKARNLNRVRRLPTTRRRERREVIYIRNCWRGQSSSLARERLTLIGSITSNQSLSLPQLLAFVAPVSSLPSVPIQLIIGWQGRARIRVFFLSQTVPQPLDHFCCDREYISLVNGTSFLPVLLCLTLPYLLHTPPRPTHRKT